MTRPVGDGLANSLFNVPPPSRAGAYRLEH